MRTTVEITDAQHRALSAVAQRRGLEGILDEQEERDVRTRIAEARATWRAS